MSGNENHAEANLLEGPKKLYFSPDRRHTISENYDDMLTIWDTFSATPIQIIDLSESNRRQIQHASVSHDGTMLAVAVHFEQEETDVNIVVLWDMETGMEFGSLPSYNAGIPDPQTCHEEKYHASLSPMMEGNLHPDRGTARSKVWNVETEECIHTLRHSSPVLHVSFHFNDITLRSGSKRDAKIWSIESGEPTFSLNFDNSSYTTLDDIRLIAFSPDETKMAIVIGECGVTIWNLRTGECVGPRYLPRRNTWITRGFGRRS